MPSQSRTPALSFHPPPPSHIPHLVCAVVGYSFAQTDSALFASEDIQWCPENNLFVCWISALTISLQRGDVGEMMQMRASTDPWYPFIVIYQFTYYILVSALQPWRASIDASADVPICPGLFRTVGLPTAAPCMQSHACSPMHATPCMQPHACSPMHAAPCMQPHACSPMHAASCMHCRP